MLIYIYASSAALCLLVSISLFSSQAKAPTCAHHLGFNYLLYALLSCLAVLNFAEILPQAGAARAVLATLLGPALYTYYLSVLTPDSKRPLYQWLHLLPLLSLIAAIALNLSVVIDLIILASFVGYWIAIVWRLKHNAHKIDRIPLKWMQLLTATLLLNVASEVAIAWELQSGVTINDSFFLKLGAILFLLFHCAALLLVLSRASLLEWMHQLKPSSKQKNWTDAELKQTFEHWLNIVEEKQLYRNESNITLARAAKLVGQPSRRLSNAINICHGGSFSRHLNECRVNKAKQLLQSSPRLSITEAFLEAGFTTKSHFYREFTRVVGMKPSEYRQQFHTTLQ